MRSQVAVFAVATQMGTTGVHLCLALALVGAKGRLGHFLIERAIRGGLVLAIQAGQGTVENGSIAVAGVVALIVWVLCALGAVHAAVPVGTHFKRVDGHVVC